MGKEIRKKQYEERHEPMGKITVTIDGELGEHQVMKDQKFVLVVGGRDAVREGHEGTDMNIGLMGKLSFSDMVDILTCACNSHPAMALALRAVYAKESDIRLADRINEILEQGLGHVEEEEEKEIQEKDLDDLIKEIFGDNKEQ